MPKGSSPSVEVGNVWGEKFCRAWTLYAYSCLKMRRAVIVGESIKKAPAPKGRRFFVANFAYSNNSVREVLSRELVLEADWSLNAFSRRRHTEDLDHALSDERLSFGSRE